MLPVQEGVLLPQEDQIGHCHSLGQILIEVFSELSCQLNQPTIDVISALKVTYANAGHFLTLKLGQASKFVPIEGKDEGHRHAAAGKHKLADNLISTSVLVDFLKICRQDDHFKLTNLQILHYFVKTNYISLLYCLVDQVRFTFGNLCFPIEKELLEFKDECNYKLL